VFPPAIRLLEQGRLNLEPLVTHQIQLKELPAAIEELRAGRATKVEVVGFA
jgi:threonine dehydrogenase-like Zn-dependent dehydrogenase